MRNVKRLIAVLALLLAGFSGYGQTKPMADTPAYMRYTTMPAFNLQRLDSDAVFNTYDIPEGQISVLMFFSPDCDHCSKETAAIISKLDSLKGVKFYLMTIMKPEQTADFVNRLAIRQYPSIQVYRDYEFFFPKFYNARTVPIFAVYDRHKKLYKLYDGRLNLEELIRYARY